MSRYWWSHGTTFAVPIVALSPYQDLVGYL